MQNVTTQKANPLYVYIYLYIYVYIIILPSPTQGLERNREKLQREEVIEKETRLSAIITPRKSTNMKSIWMDIRDANNAILRDSSDNVMSEHVLCVEI